MYELVNYYGLHSFQQTKMWNFLLIMTILLVIDTMYLIFWTSKYPFRRSLVTRDVSMMHLKFNKPTGLSSLFWYTSQDSDQDLELLYEVCYCDNFGYLIGALYVYKGLLVVFGLFLAYESRNVKYFYINDSRFVTMYIVVILVGIGAPLSLVLAVHYFIDSAYGLAVFMITAASISCLLILYIPKVYAI